MNSYALTIFWMIGMLWVNKITISKIIPKLSKYLRYFYTTIILLYMCSNLSRILNNISGHVLLVLEYTYKSKQD